MSHPSEMSVPESLSLLNELGMVEWLSNDVAASTQLIVNAVAAELLDTDDPTDFMPRGLEWPEAITDTLPDQVGCDSWFDLLSENILEAVELNADAIGRSISDHDSMLTDREAIDLAQQFANEWTRYARASLREAMKSSRYTRK